MRAGLRLVGQHLGSWVNISVPPKYQCSPKEFLPARRYTVPIGQLALGKE